MKVCNDGVKFDVALDRRSTLGFVTNPAGAQIDFVALDNGASLRREIDFVWSVGTAIEADAWVAEFRVPYTALGLAASADAREIGFNVTRDHNRRNATDDWAHLPPELGAIVVTRDGLTDDAEHDYALGLDGSLRMLDDRLVLSAYSSAELADGEDPAGAGRVWLTYSGARLQPTLSARQIGAGYDPALGFVRRADLRTFSLEVPFITRWAAGPLARVELLGATETSVSADGRRPQNASTAGQLGLVWRNGWSGGLRFQYDEDVVEAPFELLGRTVEPGTYAGLSTAVSFASPATRNPTVDGRYTVVLGFFDAIRHGLDGNVSAYLGPHVRVAAGASYSYVEVDAGDADDALALNSKLTLAASPRLFTDLGYQTDTLSEDAAVFARLRWRYLPGSDLFVVYQQQGPRDALLDRAEHVITLKLTYWADLLL